MQLKYTNYFIDIGLFKYFNIDIVEVQTLAHI